MKKASLDLVIKVIIVLVIGIILILVFVKLAPQLASKAKLINLFEGLT